MVDSHSVPVLEQLASYPAAASHPSVRKAEAELVGFVSVVGLELVVYQSKQQAEALIQSVSVAEVQPIEVMEAALPRLMKGMVPRVVVAMLVRC